MDVVFGLYLGNSTCSVAVNKNGDVGVAANAGGERVTPAVVAVHEEEIVTGLSAKQGLQRHSAQSVLGVLRDISATGTEISSDQGTCAPSWDEQGEVSYNIQLENGANPVPASTVLKHIFLQMKDISSRHHSASGQQCDACLCLPAWVSDKAVAVTRDAAIQAGFNVLAVLIQPTAACLAYNLLHQTHSNLVVTLHLGESGGVGGVLDVSGGVAVVRDTATSTTAPGKTLTNKLVDHLAKEFYAKYRGDCLENKRSRQKLYNQAEVVKHVLSTRPTAQVNCESLWEGVDFSCQVSRARFEGLIANTLTDLLQPTLDMLQRLNISPKEIDKVLLSGGTCKTPRLQQIISDLFPSADVLYTIPPDEVLACGAAIEARALNLNYAQLSTNGQQQQQQQPQQQQPEKVPQQNGKEEKNGNKKKKAPVKQVAEKKKKQTPVRSHLPVLVSAVSVPIWCKLPHRPSVLALARLTPPLLRNTFTLSLPTSDVTATVSITLYEAQRACDVQGEGDGEEGGDVPPESAVLAEIKVPISKESKELNMSCLLKPEGSLQLTVSDAATKKSRQFVVGADEEGDSSSSSS